MPRRKKGTTWQTWILIGAIAFVLATAGALLGGAVGYWWLVVKNPGPHIDREYIRAAITPETSVYFADGSTKLGTFFSQDHRSYVLYDRIPQVLIDSILAAEDATFYQHGGINYWALTRAMVANLLAGRVVQGGSTITMQTAENLFQRERPANRWLAKVEEYLNTFRLEYHFTKQDILEFYLNQFHVSGNGRGAGIAAQFFFSKPLADLDLVEAAFIACSLKGPFRYTPFLHRDKETKERVAARAEERKDYVINNLFRLGKITAQQRDKALAAAIPFRMGEFRFQSNVILDQVREELEGEEFSALLEASGINNITTAGLSIVTTIEKELQATALYAMRKHLSQLDIRLNGLRALQGDQSSDVPSAGPFEQWSFHQGTVKTVEAGKDPKRHKILVEFQGRSGTIDEVGLHETLASAFLHEDQGWPKDTVERRIKALQALKPGTPVLVSVRELRPEKDPNRSGEDQTSLILDLEQLPRVEGGFLVLDHGRILAMVGGFQNRDFNRALDSFRQVGSVFKPVLMYAALQLGWHPLDRVDNLRKIYTYAGSYYFPRPDHQPTATEMSLAWVNAYSENLASIELLYHLCDLLGEHQFLDLVEKVGLAPRPNEGAGDYTRRIRDHGIVLDNSALLSLRFEKIQAEVQLDKVFGERSPEHLRRLRSLRYGEGFERQRNVVLQELTDRIGQLRTARDRKVAAELEDDLEERYRRLELLDLSFVRLEASRTTLLETMTFLAELRQRGEGMTEDDTSLAELVEGMLLGDERSRLDTALAAFRKDPDTQELLFFKPEFRLDREAVPKAPGLADEHPTKRYAKALAVPLAELLGLAGKASPPEAVLLEGLLPLELVEELSEGLEKAKAELPGNLVYQPRVLHGLRDFRVLVGLRYLRFMLERMGVRSRIEEVLSFPLGSNALSLEEVALIYETMAHGLVYQDKGNRLALVEKVCFPPPAGGAAAIACDPDREPIYQRIPFERRLTDPSLPPMLLSLLRKVFEVGTARDYKRRAAFQVEDGRIELPLFGKTGTTNDYTNALFAGYQPYFQGTTPHLSVRDLYTVVAYTGYDDNTRMRRGGYRVTGSNGAAPPWVHFARLVGELHHYRDRITRDQQDDVTMSDKHTSEFAMDYGEAMIDFVPVDCRTGLPENDAKSRDCEGCARGERCPESGEGCACVEVLMDRDNWHRLVDFFTE